MLLNTPEAIYNPTMHLTQTELMEKFNLAFYEGQNMGKNDLLAGFENPEIRDDYLIDYLISNNEPSESDFDFNDFVQAFDENLQQTTDSETSTTVSLENTETSASFIQLLDSNHFADFDLQDLDICDEISEESLDLDNLASDFHDLDAQDYRQLELLPPVSTIGKLPIDFNDYLRTVSDDNLRYTDHDIVKNEIGHLIGSRCINNNYMREEVQEYVLPANQVVVHQNKALLDLNEDPLLSSSSLMFPCRKPTSSESESSICEEDISLASAMQCQWENCYQIYESQSSLVKHIEKCHVEIKKGEEFTCFWANCPRKVKPFNARYKLLIHMRVHSGEKPNKCPFNGCKKAFSRLENLKIHQRSHTGERPYLCQFPTCTKSFSNSSDRAKHQRTHFDTKPYACQVVGCTKKYTDPSSLRKHVKNHTNEEQSMLKKKNQEDCFNSSYVKKFLDPNRQKAVKNDKQLFYANVEHNYSNNEMVNRKYNSSNIRQDLKNKISEKNRLRNMY